MRRLAAVLSAAFAAAAFAGRSDLLKESIRAPSRRATSNNPAYMALLVNGVIANSSPRFAGTALYSAILTDEASNWHGSRRTSRSTTEVWVPATERHRCWSTRRSQSTRFLADWR